MEENLKHILIAGAGGHGQEIKEELEISFPGISIDFYDRAGFSVPSPLQHFPMIQDLDQLQGRFAENPHFALGVGAPENRERLVQALTARGGSYQPIHSLRAQVSPSATGSFDALAFSYVGPNTRLGTGVLINTRANVHHEVQIGDYTEIGPGALVLGQVSIGKNCRIGAGAVLLPGVQLSDRVVVGAGAVVTMDLTGDQTVVGVPAKPIKK